MRIISGLAKGRKLFPPLSRNKDIRPTSDRAREALFSIIGPRIIDCCAVDLFAGTGAFGCEALSRGAARIYFVDHSQIALNLIHKNIALIPGGSSKARVIKSDLSGGFSQSCLSIFKNSRFDIVFADPPYLTELSTKILAALDKSSVLSADPLIIIEERTNFSPQEHFKKLYLKDSRNYGESSFYFYGYDTPKP